MARILEHCLPGLLAERPHPSVKRLPDRPRLRQASEFVCEESKIVREQGPLPPLDHWCEILRPPRRAERRQDPVSSLVLAEHPAKLSMVPHPIPKQIKRLLLPPRESRRFD